MAATDIIQQALREASAAPEPAPAGRRRTPVTIDIDVVAPAAEAAAGKPGLLDRLRGLRSAKAAPAPRARQADRESPGEFIAGSFHNAAGTRAYKLYVPSGYAPGSSLPLIVMLHGCTQDPDDFAAGTRMNALAEEHRCLVLYPAQAKSANGSNCWNWFRTADQHRDRGEPSMIAGMTRQIMTSYRVDPERVYVAGLSAGGAMAAVLGAAYPDVYRAVGVHSGLPVGAAHDVASAFRAMKQGPGTAGPLSVVGKTAAKISGTVPVIVFHGDGDATVHPMNGDHVLAQCVPGAEELIRKGDAKRVSVEKKTTEKGRAYTRTVLKDNSGEVVAEQWVVHDADHAWSGGSRSGSYTDPDGPDASREMVRFFLGRGMTA